MKKEIKKIGIYKFESPIGRVYIGQSKDIDKRYKQHLAYKGDTKLQSSFKLYGFLNHSFEILEECNISELNEKERYWQEFYKVYDENGLNSVITSCYLKNEMFISCFPKQFSYEKGELIQHEIRYAGWDLKIILEFKNPKLEINYTGDFIIKEIIHDKYCIKWALNNRFKNGLIKYINYKYNYL